MKILLTSDDADSADILAYGLRRGGFVVALVGNSHMVVERCREEEPDLVLVEQSYAGPHSLSVCQAIRALSSVPIMMVSSFSQDEEVIRALELGVDEYVQKPVSPRQLAARLRAMLRRVKKEVSPPVDGRSLALGNLSIRADSREVTKNGQQIPLTTVEFRILQRLATNPGHAVSVENLAFHTWGSGESESTSAKLKTHISRLRKKLRFGPNEFGYIRSVPGLGYKMQT